MFTDYIFPSTVEEGIKALQEANGRGRIIAGGTDILLDLENGKYHAELLVDISRIPELQEIGIENDTLVIGAAVNLTTISCSDLVKKYAPSLAKAAGRVGALQIGNVATLAGNVVTAQPAADGAMALATLEPEFIIEGPEGQRKASMSEMYAGFAKSKVDSTKEIITYIRIPCQKDGEAAEFERLGMREHLALPMLNTSVAARQENGKFEWVRIAMGPVGVGPVRAKKAEAWLAHKDITKENIQQAAQLVLEDANPRSNPVRGSREYRMKTLPIIVAQALNSVAGQLGFGGDLSD
ncbi:FAD binding domain-containing protein [Dehalobacterium formicoaceticum]|uniref:FAD binding domain-containing protein n=1 Tax=Dehalobacterium formicoaceticum TaxID=51515 RepID=A0ABT1Y6Y6_9FIRM|nr:FAD binding domain-containing protein [Dehalobacterium formicoaceticum]MCR6546652.1 FAD binding domain-containing protein [Dehalobacterium formicoaceticum]